MEASELHNALHLVAQILRVGERSHPADGRMHWEKVTVKEHAARAVYHLERHLLQISSGEDDLANAAARLLMALELRERQRLMPENRTNRSGNKNGTA